MKITDLLARFFLAVDARDWTTINQFLAPELDVDYSSLSGEPAARSTAADLINQWKSLLPGFDATQHFLGPIATDDPDDVRCSVRGYHHLGEDTWMVAGSYQFRIDTTHDTITAITLLVAYQTGPPDLPEWATAKVASTNP
ncbi:nuclear transport factor 2 family protein [Micromonospora sp. DT81.3]|uniref:nuclear transport factor 2 family protein n=1 Tax=Micromonospora sp. DT81.3 TaxID=3416523 RepID=UPI003CF15E82